MLKLKGIYIFILFFLISESIYSQKENIIWYFGHGGLDFNYSPPKGLSNSSLMGNYGCATICSSTGQLLFYTDGTRVINHNHSLMKNGNGLMGNGSVSMSAIIVPYPGNPYLYYIFTVGNTLNPTYVKLDYNIVDMRGDSGLGEVIVKNQVLMDSALSKVTAVRHSNNRSVWVVTHKMNSDAFYAFEVTPSGINTTPVISHCGLKTPGLPPARYGYMKFSPDGKFMAEASNGYSIELFKFNNTSGTFTHWWGIYDKLQYYGVEFSPDISKLYVTTRTTPVPYNLFQFDLKAGDTNAIKNSRINIYSSSRRGMGACQIGRDKKIYITPGDSGSLPEFLHRIDKPNNKGSQCQFVRNFLKLPSPAQCGWGLPSYLSSYYFMPDIEAHGLCFGDSTSFSLSDTNNIDSVYWNFNDILSGSANFSSSKYPVHIFSDTGTFNVSVIVYHDATSDSLYREIYINPYPVTNFDFNDTSQCLTGNKFYFHDSSSIYKGTFDWEWNFGDSVIDYNQNPVHSYMKPGIYNVSLTVLSDQGCSSYKKKNVYVYFPEADFNIVDSIQCFKGNSFKFIPYNSRISGQKDLWIFGDGLTDSSHISEHFYLNPDTFTVQLFSMSGFNCKDSAVKTVIVNPSPDATFSASDTNLCFKNNSFTFTANQPAFSYSWTFGDGNIGTGSSVIHKYLTAGTFRLKLVVVNSLACRDSMMKNIVVNPSPDANIFINDTIQCLKGNSFIFNNNNQSFITSRDWWFGDLTTDTGISVMHQYSNSGSFPVKLLVTNIFNCVDSADKNVIINPSPDATFSINDSVQCLKGNSFVFNCAQTALNYIWNCGDGFTTTLNSFNHSYLVSDTFKVKLKVMNSFNCFDSAEKKVYVNPPPDATFSVNNAVQCFNGNSFLFSCNQASFSYLWDFGDGNSAYNKSETHSYSSANNYTINLIVSTKDNCTDTTSGLITVKPSPLTPIPSSNSPLCEKEILKLFAGTTETVSFQWTAKNGFTSTQQNPLITSAHLSDSGTYFVKALLNGCESTVAGTKVTINPVPDISLGKEKTICPGETLLLDPGYFDSYLWQDSSVKQNVQGERIRDL